MHRPKDNPSSERYLIRSMFFIPGHIDKYISKASTLAADAVILDVEDSVPFHEKARARRNIQQILHSRSLAHKQIVVRINELDEGELISDLDNTLHPDVLAIMPSKIYSEQDMAFFNEILKQYEFKLNIPVGSFKLIPLIETLLSFENINKIANSCDRLIALAFGGEDYLKELGGAHGINDHTFDYPRTKIAIAAKAAGLQAIDTPYLDVHDIEGFSEREQRSKDLGFEGCLLIHPKQIQLSNTCFSPSKEEYHKAKRILEAVERENKKGLSVALLDGILIGPPMKKNAIRTIKKQELINKMNEK